MEEIMKRSAIQKSTENAAGKEKNIAYIDVSVATLWTEPEIARPIDQPSTTNPVDLWKWTRSLSLEEKLWLVGKLETQALLGTKVEIEKRKGEWASVLVLDQPTPRHPLGYPGWLPICQLTYEEKFVAKEKEPFVQVMKPTADLYQTNQFQEKWMEVSFCTRLPLLTAKEDAYAVLLPNGNVGWLKKEDGQVFRSRQAIPKPTTDRLVQTAKQFLDLPYLWAGISGFGFDCSGFTYLIYQAHGITIPRDSGPQSQAGKPVSVDRLQPGDLLFFAYEKGTGRVHHVAMYIGDGQMIHSPNSARSIEIIPIDTAGYKEEFAGARRYLEE
jgi:cell wall-associated NlpC family hydrolase